MKITGHEFLEWFETAWPGEDWYHDDWSEEAFDRETGDLKDADAVYDVADLGHVYWQGVGPDPTDGDGLYIDKLIRKWRKNKTTFSVYVTGPKEELIKITELARQNGFKIKACG